MYMQNRETHKYRKQISGYQRDEGREDGKIRGVELKDTNYYV